MGLVTLPAELRGVLEGDRVLGFTLVGSRVVCEPPVLDTDIDVLVLEKDMGQIIDDLENLGYELGGSKVPGGDFFGMRKGSINLIITASRDFYDRFCAASEVCRLLNLTNKDDRVAVHQLLLYGEGRIKHAYDYR